MTPDPSQVLLTSPPDTPADDLRAALTAAGFAVSDSPFSAEIAPPLTPAAVVVSVGDGPVAAAGFVRRLRAELGERIVPVVWVAPSPAAVAAGLDAGADACLVRPVDPAVLVAQVRAAVRVQAQAAKLAARAEEARGINEQLRKMYDRREADHRLARRVQLAGLPKRLPAVGAVRFAAAGRSADGPGGWFDVTRPDDDRVGFWLADPGGESVAGGLVGLLVRQAAVGREVTDAGARLIPPAEVLDRVNRALLGLGLDPPPLVGMAYGLIDGRTGAIELARAGTPPAVHLPAGGGAHLWTGPGPFLGAFDAEFVARDGQLGPGDRLVLASAGDPDRAADAAAGSAGLSAQQLAEAVHAALSADGPSEAVVLVVEGV